jgi:hypothetical protein
MINSIKYMVSSFIGRDICLSTNWYDDHIQIYFVRVTLDDLVANNINIDHLINAITQIPDVISTHLYFDTNGWLVADITYTDR